MDRCRCDEYKCAVERLKFYIPGTYRPDVVENYDCKCVVVRWIKNPVGILFDAFAKPKAWLAEELVDPLSPEARKIEHMWCSHMSKIAGTRLAKPATGLEALIPPENRRKTHPYMCRDCEKTERKT